MSRKGQRRGSGAANSGVEGDSQGFGRRAWDQIWPLLVAVILALGVRAMVIESYYVPSGSMLPSLLIGDHVFVNKFVYGARIPFTRTFLPGLRDPERGEIVVFALGRSGSGGICPVDQCPDYPEEGFIKRIVGLPGDRVEVRRGILYLNGQAIESNDTGETIAEEGEPELSVWQEELLDCRHLLGDDPRRPPIDMAPKTVPEGRYLMLGDNRDNSNDSRNWGTVRREDLKGPAFVIYWSWNNRESWLAMANPFTWIRLLWGETRWSRFGTGLDCS